MKMPHTSPLVVGALSAAAGPVSIPFVAGYHLAARDRDVDVPTFWQEVKLGFEYGVGYYLSMQLLTGLFGAIPQ